MELAQKADLYALGKHLCKVFKVKGSNEQAIVKLSAIEADIGALASVLMGPPEKRLTAAQFLYLLRKKVFRWNYERKQVSFPNPEYEDLNSLQWRALDAHEMEKNLDFSQVQLPSVRMVQKREEKN